MITIEMLTAGVYTLAGLSAIIVVLTQIFKNTFNKEDKRWFNHLLSLITSILCNGIVLAIGLIWNIGVYAGFNTADFMSWLLLIGTTLGCTLVANGMWSYEFMTSILEWLKLLPVKSKKQENE